MTPELLSQLGVYADPNDPFSELPPEAQAAVIQQFVDQQQHHNALLHGHHPGKSGYHILRGMSHHPKIIAESCSVLAFSITVPIWIVE